MAFHVPRSGIQAMMKKGTRYMDGKEEVVYDSIATIKGTFDTFLWFLVLTYGLLTFLEFRFGHYCQDCLRSIWHEQNCSKSH